MVESRYNAGRRSLAEAVSPAPLLRVRHGRFHRSPVAARGWGEVPALANEALALARSAGSKRDEAFALVVLSVVAGLIGGAEAVRPDRAPAGRATPKETSA
jgi:hypothetical protein